MSQFIDELLKKFPKQRPPLTPQHQAVYEEEYLINRGERGGLLYSILQKLESWGHKQIASKKGIGPLLEIGPGTLNHVPFEGPDYIYDIVEPNDFFYKNSPHISRIRTIYKDISDVPRKPDSLLYKRIITKGVLEHIENLPTVIATSGLLLEDNGYFQHSIPSEGGVAWGTAWRCSTGLAYRWRTGLDYKTFMRHEHINTAFEILDLIEFFFDKVDKKYFPLPTVQMSFYVYVEATKPNKKKCEDFLLRGNK